MHCHNIFMVNIFIFELFTWTSNFTFTDILRIRKNEINKTHQHFQENLACTTLHLTLDTFKNDYSLIIKPIWNIDDNIFFKMQLSIINSILLKINSQFNNYQTLHVLKHANPNWYRFLTNLNFHQSFN
jgi:hypothetical protein